MSSVTPKKTSTQLRGRNASPKKTPTTSSPATPGSTSRSRLTSSPLKRSSLHTPKNSAPRVKTISISSSDMDNNSFLSSCHMNITRRFSIEKTFNKTIEIPKHVSSTVLLPHVPSEMTSSDWPTYDSNLQLPQPFLHPYASSYAKFTPSLELPAYVNNDFYPQLPCPFVTGLSGIAEVLREAVKETLRTGSLLAMSSSEELSMMSNSSSEMLMSISSSPPSVEEITVAYKEVISACLHTRGSEQLEFVHKHIYLLTTPLTYEVIMKLCEFKSKTKEADETVLSVFRAMENAEDVRAQMMLSRIAVLMLTAGPVKIRKQILRRLVKADASVFLIRALRNRFAVLNQSISNRSLAVTSDDTVVIHSDIAIDALVWFLTVIGERDRRLSMKIRMAGLLATVTSFIAKESVCPSLLVMKLLCRTVRSPRNAQVCGRQKNFASSVLNRVIKLSTSSNVLVLNLLTRYLEILYFLTKNRKTRTLLLQSSVTRHVYTLTNEKLAVVVAWAPEDTEEVGIANAEIALVCLALLRLLANNKKAKDELLALETIQMCENALSGLCHNASESITISKQLQDSLCALRLRCLPTKPFPLPGNSFPARFTLPRLTSPEKRGTSKSPSKTRTPISKLHNTSLDDSPSSDDDGLDEEDEVFRGLDGGDPLPSEIDEDDAPKPDMDKRDMAMSFSKQTMVELSHYDDFFAEFRQSLEATKQGHFDGYAKEMLKNVSTTLSVLPFVKIAYPEYVDPDNDQIRQSLSLNSDCLRDMVLDQIDRAKQVASFTPKVVYDFDALISDQLTHTSSTPTTSLQCDDASRVGHLDNSKDHLLFESRFESGNLRRAVQVAPNHYELILNPDINQIKDHYQWFYFEVSNMKANIPYTFEIVNCLKSNSMYSRGMQPVMYSVADTLNGRGGWTRAGDSVCYYRNLYTSSNDGHVGEDDEKTRKRYFYSIRFNITFRNKGDVCYLAYHYPYTYSYLKTSLNRCLSRMTSRIYSRRDVIGHSLAGNPIYMITVTANGSRTEIQARDTVVLSARVHPGESNASWMMHGVLQSLLCGSDPEFELLLNKFVFKLIPMLNPDGVINGSNRCSLAGIDMNRVWDKPSRTLHPEIFHSKGIIQYMSELLQKPPWVFVDLHGHSRASNIFVFGNNPEESYRAADREFNYNYEFLSLPEILDQNSPSFSIKNCRFSIAKTKESCARVAVWRQFGIIRSYTMEATYCGFETGPYKGFQIGTQELKKMGYELIHSILECKLDSEKKNKTTKKKMRIRSHSFNDNSDKESP